MLKQLAEDDKPACDDATENLETGFEDTNTGFNNCETSLDNGQNVNDGPGAGGEAGDRHAMAGGQDVMLINEYLRAGGEPRYEGAKAGGHIT